MKKKIPKSFMKNYLEKVGNEHPKEVGEVLTQIGNHIIVMREAMMDTCMRCKSPDQAKKVLEVLRKEKYGETIVEWEYCIQETSEHYGYGYGEDGQRVEEWWKDENDVLVDTLLTSYKSIQIYQYLYARIVKSLK